MPSLYPPKTPVPPNSCGLWCSKGSSDNRGDWQGLRAGLGGLLVGVEGGNGVRFYWDFMQAGLIQHSYDRALLVCTNVCMHIHMYTQCSWVFVMCENLYDVRVYMSMHMCSLSIRAHDCAGWMM